MSRPDDAERLRHMRAASREALDFVRGRRLDQLSGDRMLALALVKCIEIVGEAASKVSQPWRCCGSSRTRSRTIRDARGHGRPPRPVNASAPRR